MINIFTDPIGSGKTTRLERWIENKKAVCGILMPVIDGVRHVYSISAKKMIPLEIFGNKQDGKVVRIGKYSFSGDVFDWANEEILKSLNSDCKLFIVDEIGPLELNRSGFYSSVTILIEEWNKDIIFVVREGLVEKVISFFKIKEYKVVRNIEDSLLG